MGLLNVNSGASGNPLDALLAQNKGSLWGNLGGLLFGNYNTTTNGGLDEGGNRTAVPDGLITENDSRYQQAMRDLGGRTQLRNTTIGGPGGVRDPSKVTYDPRYGLVTDPSNLNPMADDTNARMAIVLAPALAGMALGGISGAGLGASYGDSAAALAGGSAGSAGAGSSGLLAGDESAGLSMANPFAGGAAASGGAPVTDLGVAAQGGAPVVDHSVAAAGNGLFGSSGGLLSQAGNWVVSHPLQAAGLLQTGYGLVNGGSKPGASSSSSTKGGNGNTGNATFSAPQQQFYVNPYIAAQIQRGYGK